MDYVSIQFNSFLYIYYRHSNDDDSNVLCKYDVEAIQAVVALTSGSEMHNPTQTCNLIVMHYASCVYIIVMQTVLTILVYGIHVIHNNQLS